MTCQLRRREVCRGSSLAAIHVLLVKDWQRKLAVAGWNLHFELLGGADEQLLVRRSAAVGLFSGPQK